MKHPAEEELISYQMCEPADLKQVYAIAAHLEHCQICAAHAEEIAQTLRTFSADPVAIPNLDHAWQQIRSNLPPAYPARNRQSATRWRWLWAPAFAVLLIATFFTLHIHTHPGHIHAGPLTEQPQWAEDAAAQPQDSGLALHLENAERLLTTVSHQAGPLDSATRSDARQLLLSNAVYVRQARTAGDLPEVSVLEDLGRTLTKLNHERDADDGWHVRMEFNATGLLLDIRILQQNSTHPQLPGVTR